MKRIFWEGQLKFRQFFFLIAISIFSLSSLFSFGQSGYYSTDSTSHFGVKIIDSGDLVNSKYCQVKTKDGVRKYFPFDIVEYGFKSGKVYVSKEIQLADTTRRVFLERLDNGTLKLYYYESKGIKTYFLEKDSTLFLEIYKIDKAFKNVLKEHTSDNEQILKSIQFVKYRKNSLTKLVNNYNKDVKIPFPRPRFGIVAGINQIRLIAPREGVNNLLNDISSKSNLSPFFGIYTDLPIDMGHVSLNLGVNYFKTGISYNYLTNASDVDIVVNLTSIELPFLLRYTMPRQNWRPFFNIGFNYLYHIDNSNKLYESIIEEDVITINNVLNKSFVSDELFGYSIGVGIQYHLNFKNIISTEIRYTSYYGAKNTLNSGQLGLNLGFSF